MAVAERVASLSAVRPAPFASRLLAYLLDWLVAFILTCVFLAAGGLIVLIASDMAREDAPDRAMAAGVATAAMAAPVWLVVTLTGWTMAGRSAGKLALDLKIVTRRGRPPGFGRALIRLTVALIESAPLAAAPVVAVLMYLADDSRAALRLGAPAAAGLLIPLASAICTLADRQHRALHDFAAGTRVVREDAP